MRKRCTRNGISDGAGDSAKATTYVWRADDRQHPAVDEGVIGHNPCASLRLPRMPESEIEFLAADEVERLAGAIKAPYGVLVRLLAYGGLRWGEAAALRRRRCDLEQGRIHVRESLAEVSGHLSFGPTKTHRHRVVVLPTFLVELLAAHLHEEVGAEVDALVFTSPTGAPLRYTNWRRRIWVPATAAIGRPDVGIHSVDATVAGWTVETILRERLWSRSSYGTVTVWDLRGAGFELLPTFHAPHYVLLPTATWEAASTLLSLFGPAERNPYRRRR